MPLYVADYLADTLHLSGAEHGAYLLLIMHYWQKGGLPNEDRKLASIARCTADEWEAMRGTIAEFFGEGWRHERIDAELAEAEEKYQKRAAAGQRGGKAKAGLKQSSSNATARLNQPQPHEDTDANASDAAAPVDVRQQLWSDGLSALVAITGKTEPSARSQIGKWLKDTRDDCAFVLSKIRQAQADRIGEPVSWITAALRPPATAPPKARNAGVLALRQLNEMNGHVSNSEARHFLESDGRPDLAGSGIARRIAVAPGR